MQVCTVCTVCIVDKLSAVQALSPSTQQGAAHLVGHSNLVLMNSMQCSAVAQYAMLYHKYLVCKYAPCTVCTLFSMHSVHSQAVKLSQYAMLWHST